MRGLGGSAFPDPMLAAQAKIFAAEAAIHVVNGALHMFGARGYSRDLPLERMAAHAGGFEDARMELPQTRDGYMRTAASSRFAAE